jgi:Rrf2 family cysteine metabolism transcriptional repressor
MEAPPSGSGKARSQKYGKDENFVKFVNCFYYILTLDASGGLTMKGSAKGRYGLQLMLDLAQQAGKGPVLVEATAARQELPPKFLRVLLAPLKAAGLIQVQRGPRGGCELTRHPSRISCLEVWEALEGRLGGTAAETSGSPGAQAVRELWRHSAEAARGILRGTTLADLADRERALEVSSHGYSI